MEEMSYFESMMQPEERGRIPRLQTFPDYVEFLSAEYGDREALSNDAGRPETYEELAMNVARRRAVLQGAGIPSGSMVGLFSGNCVAAVEWFLAICTWGCTAVMLPAQLSEAVMPGLGKHYELKMVIASESLKEKARMTGVPVIPIGKKGDLPVPSADVSPEDWAAVFFTGGTTGTPKGVILSHRALLRGALNGTYRNGTIYGQRLIAALPFTHVFGLVFSMLSPLYTGARVACCTDLRGLFSLMPMISPTTMIAVPGLADIMLTIARTRGIQALGGELKLIICGAAPVPPRLREGFLPLGVEVNAGYGLTETANLVCGNIEMDHDPASVGRQYPDQEMKLVDGELWVRGDMLFEGYWKDEAATREAFTEDGWFRTGDLAAVDEEGFITITGRIKNLILLPNGENVSPEEVESVYYQSPMVKDCLACEGLLNGQPVIQIEIQPMPGLDEDEFFKETERLGSLLPPIMRPSKVVLRREDFPKSPAMKIIRPKKG